MLLPHWRKKLSGQSREVAGIVRKKIQFNVTSGLLLLDFPAYFLARLHSTLRFSRIFAIAFYSIESSYSTCS